MRVFSFILGNSPQLIHMIQYILKYYLLFQQFWGYWSLCQFFSRSFLPPISVPLSPSVSLYQSVPSAWSLYLTNFWGDWQSEITSAANQKVLGSNPTDALDLIWDPTSLRGSQWPAFLTKIMRSNKHQVSEAFPFLVAKFWLWGSQITEKYLFWLDVSIWKRNYGQNIMVIYGEMLLTINPHWRFAWLA